MTPLKRFANKRSRAFIFTIDALFALALVSTLVTLFAFAYLPPARNEKFFELEQLGFDSLALEYNETNSVQLSNAEFFALTRFQRFGNASDAENAGANTIARARFYHYPSLCNCEAFPCITSRDDGNLSASDLGSSNENYSEVWVTP